MIPEPTIIAMPMAANPRFQGAQSTRAPRPEYGLSNQQWCRLPEQARPGLGPTQLSKVKGYKGSEACLDIR